MKHLTKSEERNARAKRNVAREIEYFNMQKNGPGEDAKAYFERYIRPHGKDSGQEGEMAETAAESAREDADDPTTSSP